MNNPGCSVHIICGSSRRTENEAKNNVVDTRGAHVFCGPFCRAEAPFSPPATEGMICLEWRVDDLRVSRLREHNPIVSEIGRSIIIPIKPESGSEKARHPAKAGMTAEDNRWCVWLILTGSELEPHAVSAGKSRILRSEHMYERDFL